MVFSLDTDELLPYRLNYYKALESAAKNKSQKDLMTRKWVNMMSQRIGISKRIVEYEGSEKLHTKVKEGLDVYDVVILDDASPKLVLKVKETDSTKDIVPLEETFEIVYKSHLLTSHGGVNAMAEWLANSKIAVADICLPILVESCEDCQHGDLSVAPKSPKQKNYKFVGLVDIVDMSDHDSIDDRFDCLLTYQDKRTKFLQLRPLSSADLMESISNELTLLFSDMGPPECVMVKPSLKSVFDNVMKMRINVFFRPKIELETCDASKLPVKSKVQAAVTKWMRKELEGKWCVGCFIVQWELNNVQGEDGKTPFQRMFPPISGQQETPVSESDIQASETEQPSGLYEEINSDNVTLKDVKTEPLEDIEDHIAKVDICI